eukprot:GEMP01112569.1.p1 GENE.GEMP01112569.1~~GEMP01112569.1.p1  ORF type:complete len:105 (-),score=5.05 GEMP01112569.1:57-371(-)
MENGSAKIMGGWNFGHCTYSFFQLSFIPHYMFCLFPYLFPVSSFFFFRKRKFFHALAVSIHSSSFLESEVGHRVRVSVKRSCTAGNCSSSRTLRSSAMGKKGLI